MIGRIACTIIIAATLFASACSPNNGNIKNGDSPQLFLITDSTGHRFALTRYLFCDPDDVKGTLMLVPGLGTSGRIFDLPGTGGLAPYLAYRGYDVYVLDGRGTGYAGAWGQALKPNYDWDLTPIIERDIPNAVDSIIQRGAKNVTAIGYGIGGTMLLASAASGHAGFEALITIGSPVVLLNHNRMLNSSLRYYSASTDTTAVAPMPLLTKKSVFYPDQSVADVLLFDDGIDKKLRDLFLTNGLAPIPRPVIRQLDDWRRLSMLSPSDKPGKDLLAGIDKIQSPVLAIAGVADQVAPPVEVCPYDNPYNREKFTFRFFSLVNLDAKEYSHAGLILGTDALIEVYPYIGDWLDAHYEQ